MAESGGYHPEFRIYTFGCFVVERLISAPISEEHLPRYDVVTHDEWRRRNSGRVLLKVLLSRRQRRAPRDVLLEAVCPNPTGRNAGQYLDSAASILRTVLRSPDGKSLLTTSHAGELTQYCLADQQRLWVDVEAFETSLNKASVLESEGRDPLPLLEEAQKLAQGDFLEDELYSEWAQGWRQRMNAARAHCLHRLAALYTRRNMFHQAETLLQEFLANDPGDEDVLGRLMVLLAEQGRSQEALRLYQRTADMLREERRTQPATCIRELAEQIHGKTIVLSDEVSTERNATNAPLPLSLPPQRAMTVEVASRDMRNNAGEQELGNQEDMNTIRRSLLQSLGVAGIACVLSPQELLRLDPWERLSRALAKPSSIDSTSFTYLDMLTKGCWQAYFGGKLDEVRQVLPGMLSTLTMLSQEPSQYQKALASQASQAFQVAHLFALQHQDFGAAQEHARQAYRYAERAEDASLQVASLVRLARVHFYLDHSAAMVDVFQEAMRYANDVSPLLLGRVYIGLAMGYGQLGRAQEARRYLGLAHETYPEHPDKDPAFSYTHFGLFALGDNEGLTYLSLNQPNKAWESFQRLDALVPRGLVPERVELEVRQATALLALRDIECCSYLSSAAVAARKLGVSVRTQEALRIYHRIPVTWQSDPRMKELKSLLTS